MCFPCLNFTKRNDRKIDIPRTTKKKKEIIIKSVFHYIRENNEEQ